MMKIFKLLSPFLRKRKAKMAFYIFFTFFLGLFSLANPILNGWFIDGLLISRDFNILFVYIFFVFALTATNFLITYCLQRLFAVLQANTAYELNQLVLKHISKQSLSFIIQYDPVYLAQIINNDSNSLSTFSLTAIQDVITNLLKALIPFLIFAKAKPVVALCFAILTFAYYFAYRSFKNKLFSESKKLGEIKSTFFSASCEPLVHAKFYKIWEAFDLCFINVGRVFKSLFEKSLSVQKLNWLFSITDTGVSTLAQTVIFILGGSAVIQGNLSIGNFTIFLSYFGLFIGAIKFFYSFGGSYQSILVSYYRLQEYLSRPIPENGDIVLQSVESIALHNLCFKYTDQSTPISYADISFVRGRMYAVIGQNGAGKTTLATLICGLYPDGYSGELTINKADIQSYDLPFLRQKKIAYAEQDPVILDDTILNNITLYNKEITAEMVSLLNTQLRFFDETLFQNMLEENQHMNNLSLRLSGGERQKISILRALVKNPCLLILDEPTSFLDAGSVNTLLNYLKISGKERITILITHSQRVAATCDVIFEL